MGIVERALEIIENPASKEDFKKEREEKKSLYRQLLSNEISRSELHTQLSSVEEKTSKSKIELPFIGPLYGLLRRIGISKEDAKKVTLEEKYHYLTARAEQMPINGIVLRFFRDSRTNENYVQSLLSIDIPEDISEESIKEIVNRIILAPDTPGLDDISILP